MKRHQTRRFCDGAKRHLAAGSIGHDEATEPARKGLARDPIPVILLARLALDVSLQGKGIGQALLMDALLRAAPAAGTIGARALLVHAQDDQAKGFYEHFNFESSPSDPYHLLLIMKDLVRIVGKLCSA
jgi:GNAT superfamily N-acetyltransferase